jgi:hypothetical protein
VGIAVAAEDLELGIVPVGPLEQALGHEPVELAAVTAGQERREVRRAQDDRRRAGSVHVDQYEPGV